MFFILLALPFITSYFLKKTKIGLIVRAVGDSPESASNQGINVRLVRYACILYGGAMSGLAGAYLSMIYTPQWIENMTCLLYTSPSPRDRTRSRMPSSA